MNRYYKIGIAFAVISILIGCKNTQPQDLLLGRWEVKDVIRDGTSVVGPGFHGSRYWFKDTGNVLAWNLNGDSLEVPYSRNGDTLFWVTMTETYTYLIDTVSEDILRFYMDQDGIQSLVVMRKLKSEE